MFSIIGIKLVEGLLMLITDRVQIQSKREYTDEGFLVTKARIARTGIQDYYAFELGLTDREPTEIIKMYRPESEVFNADSMRSFANKTVTDDHPTEMINADNAKGLSVGHSGNQVTRDGMFLETILHFTDAKIIKKIESGKVELSNGYLSDLEWTKGVTPDGDHYDVIQKNIKGNHIAVVDNGRCGASCRVSDHKPKKTGAPKMANVKIDGVDFEVSDQAAQAVNKMQVRLDAAEEKTKDQEEELLTKKKESEDQEKELKKDHKATLDTMQAKLDDSVSKNPTPEMLDQLVENRIATRDAALAIMPDLKWVGKDCEVIRKEVVDAKSDQPLDGKSADYYRARFDMLAEQYSTDSQKDLNDAFSKQHQKIDGGAKELTGREKFMNDTRNAWKGGTK